MITTRSSTPLMGQLTPVTPRMERASDSTSPEEAGTGVYKSGVWGGASVYKEFTGVREMSAAARREQQCVNNRTFKGKYEVVVSASVCVCVCDSSAACDRPSSPRATRHGRALHGTAGSPA